MKKNAALLLIISMFSCKKAELVDTKSRENVMQIAESVYKLYQMPGLAYLAVKNNSIVISEGIGYANVRERIPFTPQTRMLIASISKTIVATAVMQLVESGRMSLEDDINQHLPFPVRNPAFPLVPITVKMLLTHTSSISDNGYGNTLYYLFGYVDYPKPLMDFERNYLTPGLMNYTNGSFTSASPGVMFSYSNVGAALAACMVEHTAGMPFNNYCKQHIFQPLGMAKTTWFFSETPIQEMAIPYASVSNLDPKKPFYSYPTYPDGHLMTTVEDLSKFLRAYILNGTFNGYRLLKPETLDLMLQKYINTGTSQQGLIFGQFSTKQFSVWGHNGGDPGISSEMYFDREKQIGYIMFNNRGGAYPQSLRYALLHYANQ